MKTSLKDAIRGAFVAVAFSLPISLFFAFTFRYPIPMGGMIGPFGKFSAYSNIPESIMSVCVAWLFYGVLGIPILFILGALTGVIVGKRSTNNPAKAIWNWSIVVSTLVVFVLTIWDYIYGPW